MAIKIIAIIMIVLSILMQFSKKEKVDLISTMYVIIAWLMLIYSKIDQLTI